MYDKKRSIPALVVVAGILLCLTKDDYAVQLISASGVEKESIVSKNREYIQEIVDSVNEAMVYRG